MILRVFTDSFSGIHPSLVICFFIWSNY